jgi:hypothetical protein
MMKRFLLMAVVAAVVVTFVGVGASGASIPLTQSQPFQAVCEAQGGEFEVAVDLQSLYCFKAGASFTPTQLLVQRTLCERVYREFFGVEGESPPPNSTRTFCSTP